MRARTDSLADARNGRLHAVAVAAADLVFLMRPVVLLPVWVIYGAGAVLAGTWPGVDLLFVTLTVAGVYVHNQLTDVDTDASNGKLFLLAEGIVSRRAAWWTVALVWSTSLAWAAFQGERFWLYVAAMAMGVLYNGLPGQPFRPWKARPWAGLLANFLAHGPVTFLAGWMAAGGSAGAGAALSLPYGLAVAAVYLATTISDSPGDTKAGKVTWAVRYGIRNTAWTILAFLAVGAASALALGDPWMAAASAFAVIPAAMLLRRRTSEAAQSFARAGILGLGVVVAAQWPVLIGLGAVTFLAARVYYRRRFGLAYP